jgi:DNA-binding MarR family transcriptional regulator
MTHITQGLDDTVHQRTRLGILAVLAEGHRVQFGFLRETLELSDGNLSRHIATLEGAGYLVVEKGYDGRRPRTWVHITRKGKAALTQEIEAMRALVSQFDKHARPGAGADPEPRHKR